VWRYERQAGLVDGGAAESVRWSVVPTPVEMSLDPHAGRQLNIQTDGWVVVVVQQAPPHLDNEARYLAGIHASFPSSQHHQLTVGEHVFAGHSADTANVDEIPQRLACVPS